MAVGNGPAVLMGQRVQHGVVGVHRGQAVPLQLLPDNGHQLLHACVVVCPVTHDLQAVGEVAVGIREVWL